MLLDASRAMSHAVPTSGCLPTTLPHVSFDTNFVVVSSPETFTRRRALASGKSNGLQIAPGFSIALLQQSSVASKPLTFEQGWRASERRLNCTTSTTVVRIGAPL